MKEHPFIAVIDFDRTIAKTVYPTIIEPIEETVNFIRELQKRDSWIWILWTAREGKELDDALAWLESQQLYPDYVNDNALCLVSKFQNNPRKIIGDIIIDDLNYGGLKVPPIEFLDTVKGVEYNV